MADSQGSHMDQGTEGSKSIMTLSECFLGALKGTLMLCLGATCWI